MRLGFCKYFHLWYCGTVSSMHPHPQLSPQACCLSHLESKRCKKGAEIAFKRPKVWSKCPNFSHVFLIGLLPWWSWKEIYRTNEIMFNHPILKLILFPWIIGWFQTSFEPLVTLEPFDHFGIFCWSFVAEQQKHLTSSHLLQTSTATFGIQFHCLLLTIFKNYFARPGKANFTLRVWNDSWRNILSSISSGSRLLMFFSSSSISVLNTVALDRVPAWLPISSGLGNLTSTPCALHQWKQIIID